MPDQQQDYRTTVFDSIEKRLSFGFWLAFISIVTAILGVGWYVGKNDEVDTRQSNDISEHSTKIEKVEKATQDIKIDVEVIKGGHK